MLQCLNSKAPFTSQQEEKILKEPAAMYRFNDSILMIQNGLKWPLR